jgi:hypothetical protein
MADIIPRLLSDAQLEEYTGYSQSFFRNTRYADKKRVKEGLLALGPKFIKVGRQIKYPTEYADVWLDDIIAGTHPLCQR